MTLDELSAHAGPKVVVSRVLQGDKSEVAIGSTIISQGDLLHAVGSPHDMARYQQLVGHVVDIDATAVPSELEARYVLVTRRSAIGKSVPSLELASRHNVAITRIQRGEVEMTATSGVRLVFGDRVRVVGTAPAIKAVAVNSGIR